MSYEIRDPVTADDVRRAVHDVQDPAAKAALLWLLALVNQLERQLAQESRP